MSDGNTDGVRERLARARRRAWVKAREKAQAESAAAARQEAEIKILSEAVKRLEAQVAQLTTKHLLK